VREYWNSYSYVGNNPVQGIDPSGKQTEAEKLGGYIWDIDEQFMFQEILMEAGALKAPTFADTLASDMRRLGEAGVYGAKWVTPDAIGVSFSMNAGAGTAFYQQGHSIMAFWGQYGPELAVYQYTTVIKDKNGNLINLPAIGIGFDQGFSGIIAFRDPDVMASGMLSISGTYEGVFQEIGVKGFSVFKSPDNTWKGIGLPTPIEVIPIGGSIYYTETMYRKIKFSHLFGRE